MRCLHPLPRVAAIVPAHFASSVSGYAGSSPACLLHWLSLPSPKSEPPQGRLGDIYARPDTTVIFVCNALPDIGHNHGNSPRYDQMCCMFCTRDTQSLNVQSTIN